MRSETYSFAHLSPDIPRAQGYTERSLMHRAAATSVSDESATEHNITHSDAHCIAGSQEARNNPVYALALIKRNVPHQSAIEQLTGSPRHLSRYTTRKMEALYPGWELLDDEDKNMTAFSHSTQNSDSNGYTASLRAAGEKLSQYLEPMTEAEVQALIRCTTQRHNELQTPEIVAQRMYEAEQEKRRADEEGERQRREYRRRYGA
ncbi:hypothetical protein LH673_07200 [Morganella morganii]|uniref:hypothetical protein n=1 Tax=Morganella morganii TaxID=582 RepID=UPI001F2DF484|nr:hypothetical protein [Morganella morganii]MCF1265178.1 hypothetical protein [Morganella morganii]